MRFIEIHGSHNIDNIIKQMGYTHWFDFYNHPVKFSLIDNYKIDKFCAKDLYFLLEIYIPNLYHKNIDIYFKDAGVNIVDAFVFIKFSQDELDIMNVIK